MDDVICAINAIYCSTINDIDFNVLNKEIKFDLALFDNGNKIHHTMRFTNVTAFLWIEKPKDSALYSYADCDYYELTSIDIRKFSINPENDWLTQYPMEYNIAIEIWETALLINANEMSIDDRYFSIIDC